MTKTRPLASLGFILDNEAGLEAICPALGCGEVRSLDVEGLAGRYGRGVTIDQLEPRLRCRRCRRLGLRIEAAALRHGPVTGPMIGSPVAAGGRWPAI